MTERNVLWHQMYLTIQDAISDLMDEPYEASTVASVATDAAFETLDAEGVDLD